MKKPNVLFLFADDMRYDTIHALGNPDIITPNLDELAHNGVSFTQAHIPGGNCGAVCLPSRAMLATGRSLFHINGWGNVIPPEHTTIGENFLANGYNSFGTGKWHNDPASYARSFNNGSDIFFGGMYDHWKVPVYNYDPSGEYARTVHDIFNPAYNDKRMTDRRTDHNHWGEHSTDLFAEAACKYIREYDSEKPFYLFLSYMAPHDPRTMPPEYMEMYKDKDIKLPPNAYSIHPFDFGVFPMRDEVLTKVPRVPEDTLYEIKSYYAMISHLDASIGRVIQTLKDSGMYDDTIIVFAADNGLAVGQHGLMGKQNNYDHSIRVPFIISGPGIPKNETRDNYIYLFDIFATLCDYTGLKTPDSVEGKSFKRVIEDGSNSIRETIYAAYSDKVRSFKDRRYKIIQYKCKDLRKTQLFDLQNDPWEMHDLAHEPEMQDIIADLRKQMEERAVEWDDAKTPEGFRFWTEYAEVEEGHWGW